VRVLDTTLCSVASLGPEGHLEIAAALEVLGRAFERTVAAGREAKDAELRRICSPPEAWPGPASDSGGCKMEQGAPHR
jgi:hypothetical protein